MNSSWATFVLGCASILTGLSTAFLIHEYPQGLLVAAWIPYSLCAVFVLVGGAIVVSELRHAVPRRVLLYGLGLGTLAALLWVVGARLLPPGAA